MQPLVNYSGHSTCPACKATIAGGGKTCSSCGAVRPPPPPLPSPAFGVDVGRRSLFRGRCEKTL
ncbi:hypothetical protein HJFPF1_07982 [Paramyrothecium foliicola]|nr:hypothetical protein HJFPF1_07982 [Paramyrothecium foliicola]